MYVPVRLGCKIKTTVFKLSLISKKAVLPIRWQFPRPDESLLDIWQADIRQPNKAVLAGTGVQEKQEISTVSA